MGKGRKRKDAKSTTSQVNSGPKSTQKTTGATKEKAKELKGKSQPKSGVSTLLLIFAVLVALLGVLVYIALPEQLPPENPIVFRVISPENEEVLNLEDRNIKQAGAQLPEENIEVQNTGDYEATIQSFQDISTSTETLKDAIKGDVTKGDFEKVATTPYEGLVDKDTSKTDAVKEPAKDGDAKEQLSNKQSKEGEISETDPVYNGIHLEDQTDLPDPINDALLKEATFTDSVEFEATLGKEGENNSEISRHTDVPSADFDAQDNEDETSLDEQDSGDNEVGPKENVDDNIVPEKVSDITDDHADSTQPTENADLGGEALPDQDTIDKAVEINVEQGTEEIAESNKTENISADVAEADNVIRQGIEQTGADVWDILPESEKLIDDEVHETSADHITQSTDDAKQENDGEMTDTDTHDITSREIQPSDEDSSLIPTQRKESESASTKVDDDSVGQKTDVDDLDYDKNNVAIINDVQKDNITINAEQLKSEATYSEDSQIQQDTSDSNTQETEVSEGISIEKPRAEVGNADNIAPEESHDVDSLANSSDALSEESEFKKQELSNDFFENNADIESNKNFVQTDQGLIHEESSKRKQAEDSTDVTNKLKDGNDLMEQLQDNTKQPEELRDETKHMEDEIKDTLLDNKENRVDDDEGDADEDDVSDDEEEEEEEEEEEDDVPPSYHVDEERVVIDFEEDARYTEVSAGVRKRTLRNGVGPLPQKGDIVTIHCVGYLDQLPLKKFWSTRDLAQRPFKFAVGLKQVIKGWDEGTASMRFNEKSRIKIKSEKAYGKFGFEAWDIPPDADLMFEMEVIEIKRVKAR